MAELETVNIRSQLPCVNGSDKLKSGSSPGANEVCCEVRNHTVTDFAEQVHDLAQHLIAVFLFIADYDNAKTGVVPDVMPFDLGDRNVELLADAFAHTVEHSTLVLERHGVFDVKFDCEDAQDH